MSGFRTIILFFAVLFVLIQTNAEEESGKERLKTSTELPSSKLNEEQEKVLEGLFRRSMYPGKKGYKELAEKLKIDKPRLVRWFYNTRQTLRRNLTYGGNSSRTTGILKGKTVLSDGQAEELERAYRHMRYYINKSLLNDLSSKTKLPKETLSVWFHNRRRRHKIGNEPDEEGYLKVWFRFNDTQKKHLEAEYSKNRYPEDSVMVGLAKLVHDSLDKVRKWFVDKRHRERKLLRRANETIPSELNMRYQYYTNEMKEPLIHEFYNSNNRYPKDEKYIELSQKTNISVGRVKGWFVRERYRLKHSAD